MGLYVCVEVGSDQHFVFKNLTVMTLRKFNSMSSSCHSGNRYLYATQSFDGIPTYVYNIDIDIDIYLRGFRRNHICLLYVLSGPISWF